MWFHMDVVVPVEDPAIEAPSGAPVWTWSLDEVYAAPTGDKPEERLAPLARLGGSEPGLATPRRRRS